MEGFRLSLERAIRMEDEIDWSVHTVDYVLFKRRLKVFAKRRSRLYELIRASPDERIPQDVVTAILGPIAYQSPALAFLGMKAEDHKTQNTLTTEGEISTSNDCNGISGNLQQNPTNTGDYISFVEISGRNSMLQVSSHADTMDPNALSTSSSPEHYTNRDLLQTSYSSAAQNYRSYPDERMKRLKKRAIWRSVSNAERNELVLFLQWECDKAAMFYLARWQRLSHLIASDGITVALGDEILELFAFCTINIVTVRQILIRYDAFARTFEGTPLLHYYMKRVSKRQTSFKKILFHEELKALAEVFMDGMRHEPAIWTGFEGQRKVFQDILDSTQRAEAIASTGSELFTDNCIHTVRHWFLLGGIEDALGLQPEFMTQRGQSLTNEMAKLAEWRTRKHLDAEQLEDVQPGLKAMELFHLALTLVATFLYCMNYYIVEPSSTMYCNALGAYDAMQGLLIGMTPLAAFLSAIPYSMWTNRSFRSPAITSGVLLILGNLLYASAYNLKRIEVALAGRFLVGLGAPKVIVRRYMADTVGVSLRTSVNAAFGMVVAVGSALGPATAVWLNGIFWKREIPFLGTMFFNGLTGPGYLMTSFWIVYTLVVVLTFGEPRRQGLEEQKQMEQKSPVIAEFEHGNRLREIIHEDRTDMALALENELQTILSVDESRTHFPDNLLTVSEEGIKQETSWYFQAKEFLDLITLPVWVCLGLLFAKVFAIEMLASSTSAITKNRYHWRIHQVGTLGCVNGLLVIPISILVGKLSMTQQDRTLMTWLVAIGCFGFFINIDLSDLAMNPTHTYNSGHILAVSPARYIVGYFLTYTPIQCFEGIIGSVLSKVIPTALASGTLNSGLLATLVDTLGRASGDIFISIAGFLNLRQLMNLLFIPGFLIMLACLVAIRKYYDILAV